MVLIPRQFGDDWSPLAGMQGPFARGGVADPFAAFTADGVAANMVLGFGPSLYRKNGAETDLTGMGVTVSRATNATFRNASGHWEEVGSNVLRVDDHFFDGAAYVRRGARVGRTARTNVVPESRNIGNWLLTGSASRALVTGSDTWGGVAKGGITGHYEVTDASAAAAGRVDEVADISGWSASAQDVAFSIDLKRVSGTGKSRVTLVFADSAAATTVYTFQPENTSNRTPQGFTGTDFIVTGDTDAAGWFRNYVAINLPAPASGAWDTCTIQVYAASNSNGTDSTIGVAAQGVLGLDNVQLEVGNFPSHPILTAGAAATRNGDNAAQLPGNRYDHTAGAMSFAQKVFFDYKDAGQTPRAISIASAAAAIPGFRFWYNMASTRTGRAEPLMNNSGNAIPAVANDQTEGVQRPMHLATSWTDTTANAAFIGVSPSELSHAITVPDVSAQTIFLGDTAAEYNVYSLAVWGAALSAAALQEQAPAT